jgi:hypothetical protein
MGGIGKAILDVAGAFGRFADWVVKNWPAWSKQIADAWNNGPAQELQQTWKEDLPKLESAFQDIMKNAPVWIPQIERIAGAFLTITTNILQIVSALDRLNAWLNAHPVVGAFLGVGDGGPRQNSSGNFNASGMNSRGQPTKKTVHINLTVAPGQTTKLITQV